MKDEHIRPPNRHMRRRSKYGNVPTVVDGFRFDSIAESRRYSELKLFEKAKVIQNIQVHPCYPLNVNGIHICTYEADFCYFDVENGKSRVEDVKGARTALYMLKRKLMKACHGIEIEEVKV